MKAGDKIRVVDVPKNLPKPDNDMLQTEDLFRRCLGRVFRIVEVVHVEGREFLQVDVGAGRGKAASMESLWIEPEYVALVECPR